MHTLQSLLIDQLRYINLTLAIIAIGIYLHLAKSIIIEVIDCEGFFFEIIRKLLLTAILIGGVAILYFKF